MHQSPGERNYHIFYELLEGASDDEREAYYLGERTAEDFGMTSRSGTFDRRDGVDDFDEYDALNMCESFCVCAVGGIYST